MNPSARRIARQSSAAGVQPAQRRIQRPGQGSQELAGLLAVTRHCRRRHAAACPAIPTLWVGRIRNDLPAARIFAGVMDEGNEIVLGALVGVVDGLAPAPHVWCSPWCRPSCVTARPPFCRDPRPGWGQIKEHSGAGSRIWPTSRELHAGRPRRRSRFPDLGDFSADSAGNSPRSWSVVCDHHEIRARARDAGQSQIPGSGSHRGRLVRAALRAEPSGQRSASKAHDRDRPAGYPAGTCHRPPVDLPRPPGAGQPQRPRPTHPILPNTALQVRILMREAVGH